MDTKKVDLLIQFALAVAAKEDDYTDRELGPIHLIKYVYLADLAYAKRKGETFTGAQWSFYNFGPWSVDVYNRITPAVEAIGGKIKCLPSAFSDDDYYRYSVSGTRLADELERNIHVIASTAVQAAVHKFTKDTPSLLHHVYSTEPMLRAAPGDILEFIVDEPKVREEPQKATPLSTNTQKKRRKKIDSLKSDLKNKLAQKAAKKAAKSNFTAPRYDDVYQAGQEWIDSLAGDKPDKGEAEATFSSDVWTSSLRYDPDVS